MSEAAVQTGAQHPAAKERADLREAARLFQALADAARIHILTQLRLRGEVCACDLLECCGLAQPTVSYHLKILRGVGLVETEKRGSWIYYRLVEKRLEKIRSLLP